MSERAADRLLAGVEHRRDLFRAEAEDVPQDQDGPLTWREQLEGSHERQGDGLACLDTGIGTGCSVLDPLEEQIGVGLQPHHLAGGVRLGVGAYRHGDFRGLTPASGAESHEAAVGRDPVQPRANRRPGFEPGDVLPGGEERLLDGVLSVLGRAEDAVAVQLQLTPVFLDQLGEGIRVAGLRPGDQIGVDENPPIRVASAVSLVRLRYRRRTNPKSGTPAQFSGCRASTCSTDGVR